MRASDRRRRQTPSFAIFGAVPASAEPLHVGRPNIGDRERLMGRVGGILDRCRLTNDGRLVQEFERSVADFIGLRRCVATCNGTAALQIARNLDPVRVEDATRSAASA